MQILLEIQCFCMFLVLGAIQNRDLARALWWCSMKTNQLLLTRSQRQDMRWKVEAQTFRLSRRTFKTEQYNYFSDGDEKKC